MRTIPFYLVNSFTYEAFAGNPAGVFLDCDDLSEEMMRRLAGEINLESAFVMRPTSDDYAYRMRYFTGVMEVPFCGHDTVAAVVALTESKRLEQNTSLTVETAAGKIGIRTRTIAGLHGFTGTNVTLVQGAPVFGEPLGDALVAEVAAALGCPTGAITATRLPVRSVSTGTPFLFVPVSDRHYVDAAPGDLAAIADLSRRTGTLGVYVFALGRSADGNQVWSRNFAPLAGLNEDPVTGSAAGALGAYLWRAGRRSIPVRIEQGCGGGRGGWAVVSVYEGESGAERTIERIEVSGGATILASGAFLLQEPDDLTVMPRLRIVW